MNVNFARHLVHAYSHLIMKGQAYDALQNNIMRIRKLAKDKNPEAIDRQIDRLESCLKTIISLEKGHASSYMKQSQENYGLKVAEIEAKLDKYLAYHDSWSNRMTELDKRVRTKIAAERIDSEIKTSREKDNRAKQQQIAKLEEAIKLLRKKYQVLHLSRKYGSRDLEKIRGLIETYEARIAKIKATL